MKAWVIQFQLIETKPLPRTWVIYRKGQRTVILEGCVGPAYLVEGRVAHRISLTKKYRRGN